MLTKWTVENFKSIYEPTPIELAPLTVFAGANSSGKSTIIQSILLTAQTVQSPVLSKSVVLNGHILRLGAFNDIVSNTRESESVRIGFSLSPPEDEDTISRNVQMHAGRYGFYDHDVGTKVRAIELSFSFNTEGSSDEPELLQLQPQLAESRIKVRLRENEESQDASQRMRGADKAWRRDIDKEFHLHYWETPAGIEFAAIVVHNDFTIP